MNNIPAQSEGTEPQPNAASAEKTAVEKPPKAATKRKPKPAKAKAAKPKGKAQKSARASKGRQKRSGRNPKGSGDAKTTPYRPGSNYQAIVDALAAHKGKAVDFATLKSGVKAAMGTGWAAFAKREGRNENAKDTDSRIHQNVCTLQRKADYAKPLTAMGLEIVKAKDEKRGWLYTLTKIGK